MRRQHESDRLAGRVGRLQEGASRLRAKTRRLASHAEALESQNAELQVRRGPPCPPFAWAHAHGGPASSHAAACGGTSLVLCRIPENVTPSQ
jgi:hypothetical protein